MISSSIYNKKPQRKAIPSEKRELTCQKSIKQLAEPSSDQFSKIKPRNNREKPIRKDQTKDLHNVKQNNVIQQQIINEKLSEFSKHVQDKIKLNVQKNQEQVQIVNANGFTKFPPPFTQALPPILMLLIVIEIILVTIDCISSYEIYIVFDILGLLLLLMVYFWYKTTSICPTDSIQLQHLEFIKYPQTSSFQSSNHKYFCNVCKTCIGQKSFHCNKCNRCVQYFDHHCKWINNCVGSRNYIEFILLLVWSWLFMVFFFSWNGIVIYKIVNENVTDQFPGIFWYAVIIMTITVIPFIALSMLLFLHVYLIASERTTLELILESRKSFKIYPQNSSFSLVEKKSKQFYIPDESPINSPSNHTQNSVLFELNGEHNQNLLKFMNKLNSNLKSVKKSQQMIETQPDSCQNEKKLKFKPTILKKNTQQRKNQTKVNTSGNNRVIQFKKVQRQNFQQQDNIFHNSSQMDLPSKNFVSPIKFSSKKQTQDELARSKTDREVEKQKQNCFTERIQNSQKKRKNPKILSPIEKIQTEKKIRFKPTDQNIDAESQKIKDNISNFQKKPSLQQKNFSSLRKNQTYDESQGQIQFTKVFHVNSLPKNSQVYQ